MKPTTLLFSFALMFSLASCSTDAETSTLEEVTPNDSMATTEIKPTDTSIKPVDYIPPIGTGQSSAGNVKRERKFYIR